MSEPDVSAVLVDVINERRSQHERWGEQSHHDGTGGHALQVEATGAQLRCEMAFAENRGTWRHILEEEVAEAFAESDPVLLRAELVQVAAVAIQWVEAIDLRLERRAEVG
jgi:hypothetical protein